MVKVATRVELNPRDEEIIRGWIREAEQQQRRAERGKIVLYAAQGWSTQRIARTLGERPSRVSKWRKRYASAGLSGLETAPRPGRPRRYDPDVDLRILSLVVQPPPEPHLVWSGPILAERVGNVSVDHVWKVLRDHGIALGKLDPLLYETTALTGHWLVDLGGLYLAADTCAFLVCASPGPQSLEAVRRSYVRVPDGRIAESWRQRAPGPATLLEALTWASALLEAKSYPAIHGRSLHSYLSDVQSEPSATEVHAFVFPHPPHAATMRTHKVSSFGVWRDHLKCWITVLLRPPDPAVVSELISAIERVVWAERQGPAAAFEWYNLPLAAKIPAVAFNRGA